LVGKPEGKRPFGRPRSRWEDNIRMDLRIIRWEVVYWIHLVQDRDQWRALVNTLLNLRFPSWTWLVSQSGSLLVRGIMQVNTYLKY